MVDGIRWKWICGRSEVVAHSETGIKLTASLGAVKGLPEHLIERGRWKKSSDGAIMPSEITKWIRQESIWKKSN